MKIYTIYKTLKPKNYIILPYRYKQLIKTVILQACRLQNSKKLKTATSKLQTMKKMAKKNTHTSKKNQLSLYKEAR